MPGQNVSPPPGAVGPRSWKEETLRSVRRAELLVRRLGGVQPNLVRDRSRSAGPPTAGRPRVSDARDRDGSAHLSKAATCTRSPVTPSVTTLALPFLREQCGEASMGVAMAYMRCVRGVEAQLRGLAAKVWLECRKLERDQGHLEKMLRILRKDILVNRKSVEDRTQRPATTETGRDGADNLLEYEKKELTQLKTQLEGTLRDTVTQVQVLKKCSKMLLDCANERSRVLDLLPRTGSHSAGGHHSPVAVPSKPSPLGSYSPDCGQVMESSGVALKQSRALRDRIRCTVGEAIARQRATHQSVNEGLVKKIAETITLKQHLTVSTAATRQAVNRKQRQLDSVELNHGRALGPVSRGDLFSRERLNRPVVEVYQRHPDTELPEAMNLVQGTALLQKGLSALSEELSQLNCAHLRLVENLHGKETAAQVDSAVVRQRRREVDHRGMQTFFLQDTS